MLWSSSICGTYSVIIHNNVEKNCLVSFYSDPLTYKTFNGVEAGDIGAKCGWNGLDNGYENHLSIVGFIKIEILGF